MGGWSHYAYFPPSRPRKAKGGIKARSRRGAFGQSWWAKRWARVLEGFHIGARLSRGRNYARRGQVVSIDVGTGRISAVVQGSRAQPYMVEIGVKTLSAASWKKLGRSLASQALFAAKLLAGEMPPDIEEAFEGAGLSLFPARHRDLETECSCPDWSNPCKHIAAVYYLLGEEFDRDPFLIFELRGMTREGLVELIGDRGGKRAAACEPEEDEAPAAEPLPADPAAFWGERNDPDDSPGEVHVPPMPAALPRRLGGFPFWRSEEGFLDAMDGIFAAASPRGLEVLAGGRSAKARD